MSAVLLGDLTYNTMSFEAMRLCYAAQSHVQVSHLMLVVDSRYCTGSLHLQHHLHTFTATCNHSPKSKNWFSRMLEGKVPSQETQQFLALKNCTKTPTYSPKLWVEWLPGRAWCLAQYWGLVFVDWVGPSLRSGFEAWCWGWVVWNYLFLSIVRQTSNE